MREDDDVPIVDNGVYVAGHRIENPASLDQTFEYMREKGGMAWIGLFRPTPEEIAKVAEEFSLHPLAVEDALSGHQRAKLERYGEILFAVLRPAKYDEDAESVEFGELHVFVGPDFVVTIRHAESPDLGRVRRRLEAHPELLVARSRGRAVRDPRRGRRRVHPGRGRSRERHRRDRGRSSSAAEASSSHGASTTSPARCSASTARPSR